MNDKLDVKTGVKDTLPTVFGYIGIGLAFGIIASSIGLNPFFVGAMSLFIYAGGAQFVTVSMLSSGFPILSIIIATFLINSRMILMSMAVAPFFKKYSIYKNISIGTLLTDESFALGMNKQNYTRGILTYEWFNAVNLVSYFTWVVSSVIGGLLGGVVKNPKALGLDFALVAMFIGLLYLQVISDITIKKKVQFLVIVVVFFLVYFGMIFIPSNVLIIVVTLIGCAIVTWLSRILPFILLKKFDLPKAITEYLSLVPIVIMSALWFDSLFIQKIGQLPQINYENLFASLPTVLSAIISKSLLVIVVVGIVSLAIIRLVF